MPSTSHRTSHDARRRARPAEALFYALLGLTAVAFVAEVFFIFLKAPVEARMGIVQKIFYFHVPSWYAMYIGATCCFLGSMAYFFRPTDFRDAFARVGATNLPVLLFWGRDDRTVPFVVSDEVRKAMPRAEFHPVDGAGHIPQYERPDVVAPAILYFTRRARDRAGRGTSRRRTARRRRSTTRRCCAR